MNNLLIIIPYIRAFFSRTSWVGRR